MTVLPQRLNWNKDVFLDCYYSIRDDGVVNDTLLSVIKSDLIALATVPAKSQTANSSSSTIPEEVEFSDGKFKLNISFRETATILLLELNIDPLVAAELCHNSSSESFRRGTDLLDSARSLFFHRIDLILQIVGFLAANQQLETLLGKSDSQISSILPTLMASFETIHTRLKAQNDIINKQKATGDVNSLVFSSAINFTKQEYLNQHENLAKLLYTLIQQYPDQFASLSTFDKIIQVTNKIPDNDIFIVHFLPALLEIIYLSNDKEVEALYKKLTDSLKADYSKICISEDEVNIEKGTLRPLQVFLILVLLIRFIQWCKEDESRVAKYSFTDDILKYIEWCISFGAFEKFLCIAADTAVLSVTNRDDMYDFRLLMERSLPRLLPILLRYQNGNNSNIGGTINSTNGNSNTSTNDALLPAIYKNDFSLSSSFTDELVAPLLHQFVKNFVTYAAVVLTLLRDSEEDFLLSLRKETELEADEYQLDLDELASRADLERFYFAASYLYSGRHEIISDIWESSDFYGFVHWASANNTLPLITASFCILLGSLANASTGLKIWEILINLTTMKKKDFLKILADSIVESLQYYIDSLNSNFQTDLNTKRLDFLRLEEDKAKAPLIIELAEDSLVFISGFIQLIGGIAESLSGNDYREVKSRVWSRFKPIIEAFLEFDNKIIIERGNIRVLDDNRATLINLMLNLLSSFVDENLETRYEIWTILDRWIYLANGNKQGLSARPIQVFLTSITRLTQVELFIDLVGLLLKPLESNKAFDPYRLLYPQDLGFPYRSENIGVWPYVEFLLEEVFTKSNQLGDVERRKEIQNKILLIIKVSLENVDWSFLCNTAQSAIRTNINLDTIVEGKTLSFSRFVKLHHSLAFLSYLYDSKIYNALIQTFDRHSNYDFDDFETISLAIQVIKQVVDLQGVYNTKLIGMLKNNEINIPQGAGEGTSISFVLQQKQSQDSNIYYKLNLHTADFCEVFLFNLSVVATFGTLVGSSDAVISSTACSLLKIISKLPFFSNIQQCNDNVLGNNRLLTTFEEVDESNRIKFAFIQQMESPADDIHNLQLKYDILDFLLDNSDSGSPNVAHFLLGFERQGDFLKLSNPVNTLLKTLVFILTECLDLISYVDFNRSNVTVIDGRPATLSAKILELFVKLCQAPITSQITLEFLRNYEVGNINIFTRLLGLPRIDEFTEWSTIHFDKSLSSNFLKLEGPKTLISFIALRDQLLKYFALELHNSSSSILQKQLYVEALLKNNDFLDGTPKALQFLDVGILNFEKLEIKLSKYSSKYNLEYILEEMGKNYDLSVLEKIFKLICTSQYDTPKDRQVVVAENVMDEGIKFTDLMLKCAVYRDFRAVKLASVHSWVQLIQVILTDTDIDDDRKSFFVLEVFQSVLPRINEYLERDVLFAEELISLCVLLFDVYEKTNELKNSVSNLIPLFLTCIAGIVSLQAAPDLRLDLYVLLCRFLQKLIGKPDLRKELISYLKSAGNKFVDIICNDAIFAEGAPRVTGLVLLEQLVHLSSTQKNNFVFDSILKNNLLMLLARLIKRTDEIISLCSTDTLQPENSISFSASTLLYELTAFKLTIYLLVRIASTRSGALQLVQNEIFPIILECKFLQVDPDVGMYLHFQESKEHGLKVKLLLDIPLTLSGNHNQDKSDGLSYYEFLVPVFQLVNLVLISMGPSYQPGVVHGKQILEHFKQVIVGVIKRDALLENNELPITKYRPGSSERLGLEELMKLITLLDCLVNDGN